MANIYFNDNAIYVCDLTKILVYDFNGEYLKTIIPPKDEIGQFYIDPSGLIVQSRYYLGDSQLIVYDEDGKLIKEYFHVPQDGCVVLNSGNTESLNTCIKGILKKGDHVITTYAEHNKK